MILIDFRSAAGRKFFWNIGKNTESGGPNNFDPGPLPKDFDPSKKVSPTFTTETK
jgi:hypothetical protein